MKQLKLRSNLALTLVAALLLSACGGESYRQSQRQGSEEQPLPPGDHYPNPSIPPVIPGDPSMSFSFSISGNGGTRPNYTATGIYTDSILRVTVRAMPGGALSLPGGGYSNYSATYQCVSYEITVGGRTVRTSPLAVTPGTSHHCPNAPNSQTIDFSDRLGQNPGAMSVRVANPMYDTYCSYFEAGMLYPYYWTQENYNRYCSPGLYTVYRNHTVSGSLDITINGSN